MRGGERGYALLLAIAVVAVLALTVLASARALADVTASVARLQERRDEAIRAESLMSRTAFWLTTEAHGARGLSIGEGGEELRFDGAWYAVGAGYVSVQDEAGLFNLNAPDEQGLAAVLARGGVAGEDASGLAAALVDYVDADDLARDGGAEGRAYARAGLAAPANHELASAAEALEAMGWSNRGLERSALWSWLTARPADAALNINTAPEPILQALLGDGRRAREIVSRREAAPFLDAAEVEALTAASVRADGVSFAVAPANGFRVRAVFGSQGPRHGIERRVELGDADSLRPFSWIEEREVRLAPLRDGETVNSLSVDAPAS